jgi:hypothetical protein
MMLRHVLIGSFAGLAMLADPATAQGRGSARQVPPGHLPPAGMCRAWIDGVPPGRQPRVTDCRTARAQAARFDGRVIYGDDYAHKGKAKGKHKNKDRRDDDRYGRRDDDRRDGRYDGRRDRDDGRDDGRRDDGRGGTYGSHVCVDANRDGRCDAGTPAPRSGSTARTSPTSPSSGQRSGGIWEQIEAKTRADAERRAQTPR